MKRRVKYKEECMVQKKYKSTHDYTMHSLDLLKSKYGVSFPIEVVHIWNLAQTINKDSPLDAFKDSLGLRLAGPFEFLHGSFDSVFNHSDEQPILKLHLHRRFFYDPPEFMTVLYRVEEEGGREKEKENVQDNKSNKQGAGSCGKDTTTTTTTTTTTVSTYNQDEHWGYFRDKETELPKFVAHAPDASRCEMLIGGDNLVSVLYKYALQSKKSSHLAEQIKISCVMNGICVHLPKKGKYSINRRKKDIIVKTFNNLGIVVKYDKITQVGYRPLGISDPELKQLLHKIVHDNASTAPLKEIVNWSNIANDESDFGMSLQLGLNLFFSHNRFTKIAAKVLKTSYLLQDQSLFSDLIQLHCCQGHRKMGNIAITSVSDEGGIRSSI